MRDPAPSSLGYGCNGRPRDKGVWFGGKYLPDLNNSSVRCREWWAMGVGREGSTSSVKEIASFLGMRAVLKACGADAFHPPGKQREVQHPSTLSLPGPGELAHQQGVRLALSGRF